LLKTELNAALEDLSAALAKHTPQES